MKTLADIQAALVPYTNHSKSGDYTLDTVKQLAGAVGSPEERLKVIHVAGTSGKTSTSYYIANLLGRSGKKVGLTVSPHIVDLRERAQIIGQEISEEKFVSYFDEYLYIVEKTTLRPSYFELMMVFALWFFDKENVDYAVVETGLGGLLDASNICRRSDKLVVLTDIGYDHTEVLGSTIQEISFQKAGIISRGNLVVMRQQSAEVMKEIEEVAERSDARIFLEDFSVNDSFLERNFGLARRAVSVLANRDGFGELSDVEAKGVFDSVRVPGRIELIKIEDTIFLLDGAHNDQKMSALVAAIKSSFGEPKWTALVAVKAGKDASAIAGKLREVASDIVATEFHSAQDLPIRSLAADELAKYFEEASTSLFKEALEKFIKEKEPRVLVTGSLYLVSQAREWLIDYNGRSSSG